MTAQAKSPAKSPAQSTKRIKITQLRSTIGFDRKQALAMRGLGLRRNRHTVDVVDTPETRGQILNVRHLVKVEGE